MMKRHERACVRRMHVCSLPPPRRAIDLTFRIHERPSPVTPPLLAMNTETETRDSVDSMVNDGGGAVRINIEETAPKGALPPSKTYRRWWGTRYDVASNDIVLAGDDGDTNTDKHFCGFVFASFDLLAEIVLTIVSSQITYNYAYQIMWPITCMCASFLYCVASLFSSQKLSPWRLRALHATIILAALIGASTSRYALMSSDVYVCTRKTNNQWPTFVNVNYMTGETSLIPGKPSCSRSKLLYGFELLAFATRLACFAFTARTL